MPFPYAAMKNNNPPTWRRAALASFAAFALAGCIAETEQADGPLDSDGTIAGGARVNPGAGPSEVEQTYLNWRQAHESRGGDAALRVRLSRAELVSAAATEAEGEVHLDLVNYGLSVNVKRLQDEHAGEVWLVDNLSGGTFLPDTTDNMLKVGTLALAESGSGYVLEAELDPELFQTFRVDMVVVTLPGQSPADAGVLFARLPFFNRVYTNERLDRLWGLDARGFIDTDTYIPAVRNFDVLVARGFDLFVNETFDGNGRTCNTCHRVENNFTIDSDFIATLPQDDPLFVHENVPALAELESPQMLRQLGLIRAPTDGFDRPATLRSTSHIKGIATSINISAGPTARNPEAPFFNPDPFGPVFGPYDLRGRPQLGGPIARARVRQNAPLLESTGWSGDGAPHSGGLVDFAAGAVAAHATRTMNRVPGVDFRVPDEEELDAMLVFQLAIGRQRDIDTSTLVFNDPKVQHGFDLYTTNAGGCKDENGVPHCACTTSVGGDPCGQDLPHIPDGAGCANCHVNAGANSDLNPVTAVRNTVNINFDIGTVGLDHPEADAITAEYGEPRPRDCGLGNRDDLTSWCEYVVSWPPYVDPAPCSTGHFPYTTPASDLDPDVHPDFLEQYTDPTGSYITWPYTGMYPLPGVHPKSIADAQIAGKPPVFLSLCDVQDNVLPLPIITAGLGRPDAAGNPVGIERPEDCPFTDAVHVPPVFHADGTVAEAGYCKCGSNNSCITSTGQWCEAESGFCLPSCESDVLDLGNPEHAALVLDPVTGAPTRIFNTEDDPATPQVDERTRVCKVCDKKPNPVLTGICPPFFDPATGAPAPNPIPGCGGCMPFCPPGVPGCVECWVEAGFSGFEDVCTPENGGGYGDKTFSPPPLIEAPDTAPYFHDHSARTLEDAIRHYTTDTFNNSPAVKPPNFQKQLPANDLDEEEVAALAAYMRALNAFQNSLMAHRAVAQAWHNPLAVVGDARLAWAETELEDAEQVLKESRIHRRARVRFKLARRNIARAFYQDEGTWDELKARIHMAIAVYHMQKGREDILTVPEADTGASAPGDADPSVQEWGESNMFSPTVIDAIVDTIVDRQPAEEAAFDQAMADVI